MSLGTMLKFAHFVKTIDFVGSRKVAEVCTTTMGSLTVQYWPFEASNKSAQNMAM